jgi:hypothetical protein
MKASEVDIDMTVEDVKLQFENLGFMTRVFQGILNLVGSSVFNTVRKKALSQLDGVIIEQLDAALKDIPCKFSPVTPPIDVALQHASRMAREMKFDPFKVPPQKLVAGAGTVKMNTSDMVIYGISKVPNVQI